jgi:hypothetical protein
VKAKTCSRCGESKPETDFPLKYDADKQPLARKSICKKCQNRARHLRRRTHQRGS